MTTSEQQTGSFPLAGFLVAERHRIELEPVVHQFVAELARDLGLKPLDLFRLKLWSINL